jgi:UDP-glucose 4-epimerase
VRVLVTGAAGFIGSQLTPALVAGGHEVFALVRNAEPVAPDGANVIEVDLASFSSAELPAVDVIVHLAQANVSFPGDADTLYRVNTLSTQQLLEHGRRSRSSHFVYASSGSVYGFGEGPVAEDDARRSDDFYAVTKQNAERLVHSYAPFFSTAILRLFTPYGPTQTGRLIPGLVARVRGGLPVTLNEDGRPRLTPVFVDDVVRVFRAACGLEGHHVVNIAGDEVASIRDLAELIGAAVGRAPLFEHSDQTSADLIADKSRMQELFSGPAVPLAEGLRRTALAPVAV